MEFKKPHNVGRKIETSRRSFLKQTSLLVATAGAGALLSAKSVLGQVAAERMFAVAETTSGKVQGFDVDGIKTFYGIPYGASTAGRNRYMPPQKPAPWTGVRDAFTYGQISPQSLADPRSEYVRAIEWDKETGGMGEDCLVLNVWTPGLKDGRKRPVMVSFHGGGFSTGSANLPGYYGDPLARFGDVVVVTMNHRLSALGFLHLADLGAPPEFAQAGNVGMLDLVESLKWIRDNIENFGGDPNTVFIFGQSGGGRKTSVTMALPSAKGLFQRAGVQSGSMLRVYTREGASASAEKLLKQLGIDRKNIPDIQKLPWEQILEAQLAVGASAPLGGFMPVVDGTVLPRQPFDPTAPDVSADVPMIISTAQHDAALALTNYDLDEAGLKTIIQRVAGNQADRVYTVYRKAYPDFSPFLIQAQIMTDRGYRADSYVQAERKSALGKAPAYLYVWEWHSPAFGGKFGAIHGTDVGMVFHNTRSLIEGDNPESRMMADKAASVWLAFARTGDPNCAAIPHWPAYDATTRATLIFDKNTRVENDPLHDFRTLWKEIGVSGTPGTPAA
jgi:para-nitrobenzyl esterase